MINFGAGPAKLPEEVMFQIQKELINYPPAGISVMEISHRSPQFNDIIQGTDSLLRELMGISSDYEVLLLQGGGTGQFGGVPLNLGPLSSGPEATYAITGVWSKKAAAEGSKYLTANKAFDALDSFTRIPSFDGWNVPKGSAYLYYCANETVHGVEYQSIPDQFGVDLVADVSSNMLSKEFDVSKHGVVFGATQKNVGAAGLTISIVRKDLIGKANPLCPAVLNYKDIAAMGSIYNTPPVFSIYVTKLVLEWIKRQGGVSALDERNKQKSQMIYDMIDSSDGFYRCPVDKSCRSRMNVPFRIGEGSEVEDRFLAEAKSRNMIGLKGHRSVGGIRASLYNAITLGETEQLATLMKEFREKENNNS